MKGDSVKACVHMSRDITSPSTQLLAFWMTTRKTFKYRIHWNINFEKVNFFLKKKKKIAAQDEINMQEGSINQKSNDTMSAMFCTRELLL